MIHRFLGRNSTNETNNPVNSLVDMIWRDFDCDVSRDRIRQLVLEETKPFQDAVAAKFVPSVVHRRVRIRLIEETS